MHHTHKRTSLILALAIYVAAGMASAAVAVPHIAEATPPLLTAGICRIESERSYKLSLQMTLGILGEQARKERDRSIATVTRLQQDLVGAAEKSTKAALP
jgi:hypothetical protein